MPEGDAVYKTARRLDRSLAGKVLTATDFRVPRFATVDLSGDRIGEVCSIGKHLVMRTEGGYTIHSHLRMDGRWRLFRRHGFPTSDPSIRVLLQTEQLVAVGFDLGLLEVLRTAEEDRVLGHLGPDILSKGFQVSDAVARLRAKSALPIKVALLDQTLVAGIGNIYASESLFLAHTHPFDLVRYVDSLEAVVSKALDLMTRNTMRAGTTTGPPGVSRHWVYRRSGRPCLVCGTRIRRGELGPDAFERVCYWCPVCQASRGPERQK